MQTVFEAAGCNDGLRRPAYAWYKRVVADICINTAARIALLRSVKKGAPFQRRCCQTALKAVGTPPESRQRIPHSTPERLLGDLEISDASDL